MTKIVEFRRLIREEVLKVLSEAQGSKEFKAFLKSIEMRNLKRGHLIYDLRVKLSSGLEGFEAPDRAGPGQVSFFFRNKNKMLLAYDMIKKRFPKFGYEAVQLVDKNYPSEKHYRLALTDIGVTPKPEQYFENVPIPLL